MNFNTEKNAFNGTINISSNIKDNKRAIIGNYDLKDIMFILIGILLGLLVMTLSFVVFGIKNVFIILLLIGLVEIPIITLGFRRIYNIPYLDYIIMNNKSKNTIVRSNGKRKVGNNASKYIICYELIYKGNDGFINEYNFYLNKIDELNELYHFDNCMLKMDGKRTMVTLSIYENEQVNYRGIIDTIIKDKSIKFLSYNEIKMYNDDIYNTRIYKLNYNKKNNKDDNKRVLSVYRIKLYLKKIDIMMFDKIRAFTDISMYFYNNENVFTNTYFAIKGDKEVIDSKIERLKDICNNEKVLLNEIREEGIKGTISLIMENKY